MENNTRKVGSGLLSYDQHIDNGKFLPQNHLLMVGGSQPPVGGLLKFTSYRLSWLCALAVLLKKMVFGELK